MLRWRSTMNSVFKVGSGPYSGHRIFVMSRVGFCMIQIRKFLSYFFKPGFHLKWVYKRPPPRLASVESFEKVSREIFLVTLFCNKILPPCLPPTIPHPCHWISGIAIVDVSSKSTYRANRFRAEMCKGVGNKPPCCRKFLKKNPLSIASGTLRLL